MKKITFYALLLTISTLQACGQKGPLEVERPQVQQESENSDTR